MFRSTKPTLAPVQLETKVEPKQAFKGAGAEGWVHITFSNQPKEQAAGFSQELEDFKLVNKAPNVTEAKSHPVYPDGTFYLRIHHTAYPKIAEKYHLPKVDTLKVATKGDFKSSVTPTPAPAKR